MPFDLGRKYGRNDPARRIQQLLNRHAYVQSRRNAARELSRLPTDRRILLALAEVLVDDDPGVKDFARAGVAASGQLGVEILSPLLTDPPPHSIQAARALGYIREPRSAETLFDALRSSHPAVAAEAALSLGLLGDIRAVEPLCGLLITGVNARGKVPDHLQLTAAVQILASLRDPRAIDTLCRCLDGPAALAEAAATALGSLHNPRCVDALGVAATTASHAGVRYAAASALGQFQDPRVFRRMCLILADPDRDVRKVAAGFLARIPEATLRLHLEGDGIPGLVEHLERTLRHDDRDAQLQAARLAGLLCCVELLPVLRKRTRQLPLPDPALAGWLQYAIDEIEHRIATVGNRPIPASAPAIGTEQLPIAAVCHDSSCESRPLPAAGAHTTDS